MRTSKLIWIFTSILLIFVLVGCGGGANPPAQNGDQPGAGGESPVDPATAGAISGSVAFTGTAPDPEPILMDAEQVCADKHPDGAFKETVVVNDNGTLRNVFIYLKDGLPDLEFPVPTEPVVLDQTGCQYVPHVFGVQVGQDLIIRNSDGILHNIHPMPVTNRPFNLGQPVEMDTTRVFDQAEMFIEIECDVHEWMLAYVSVLDNPYFATTGEDGSFSLANLPPGTYTVAAWHELYGEQTSSVTIGEGETAEIEFSFAGN